MLNLKVNHATLAGHTFQHELQVAANRGDYQNGWDTDQFPNNLNELTEAMLEVSGTLLHKAPLDMLLQGIPAGFLIASVAWIRAGVSGSEFWVILVLTYAIALGDFAHVVAGSAEAFLLLFAGQTGLGHAAFGIVLPSLIGNVIGGTGLFALLAHAQVRQEM